MLAVMLLVSLTQGPQGESGAAASAGFVVEGSLELTRAEAEAAALRAAHDEVRLRNTEFGQEVAGRCAPFWLPGFVVDREVASWTEQAGVRDLRVLERATEVRRYSYGDAYQTTLRVAAGNGAEVSGGGTGLERRLHSVGKEFLVKCGGVAAWWGLLALLSSWLDRLSRGYMTWRLRLLALGLAIAALPVVLLT